MQQAAGITAVDTRVIVRIYNLKLRTDAVKTVITVQSRHISPGAVVDSRHVVYATHNSVDIHHRTATHHRYRGFFPHRRQQSHYVTFEPCGAIVLFQPEETHEMMDSTPPLPWRGSGGAYGYVTVNLTRIGRNDVAGEMSRYGYGKVSLARSCRSGDHHKSAADFRTIFHALQLFSRFLQSRPRLSPSKEWARTHSGHGNSVLRQIY